MSRLFPMLSFDEITTLKALAASGGTAAQTPAPTPAPPSTPSGTIVSFSGAAGAPTGPQAVTAVSGSSFIGATLDGSGDILLPTAAFSYGVLAAAPAVPATGVLTATFKAGGAAPFMFGRLDATGQNGGFVVFFSDHTALVSQVGGTGNIQSVSTAIISGRAAIGLQMNTDGTWEILADGQGTGVVFAPPAVVAGYAAMGSSNGSTQAAVSSIAYQSLADFSAAYLAANPPIMTITGVG